MAAGTPSAAGSTRTPPGRSVDAWAAHRRPYLDNLKVALIAAIIAIHGVAGYVGSVTVWTYADVQEVTLSPVAEGALLLLVAPFAVFLIGLLFLVAGLLSPASLQRKGPGRFARDRLLRLGIPYAVFVLLLWPVVKYSLLHPLGGAPGSFWSELVADGSLDSGPLWFVGVLLVFSLVYAGWARLRGPRTDVVADDITSRRLLAVAASVAAATFVVRLAFPIESSRWVDLNLYEWPTCVALFALGIATARRGWLDTVPSHVRRVAGLMTLTGASAAVVLLLAVGTTGRIEDLAGGWTWPALGMAVVEGTLTVFGPVWGLAVAQTHLDRTYRHGPPLGRSAYAAFVLQAPVLVGLAVALRPVPVPAEVKALVVAVGGVTASFALAWVLVTRVPLANRVL